MWHFTDEQVDWIMERVGVQPVLRARRAGKMGLVTCDGTDIADLFYHQDYVYEDLCRRLCQVVPDAIDAAVATGMIARGKDVVLGRGKDGVL